MKIRYLGLGVFLWLLTTIIAQAEPRLDVTSQEETDSYLSSGNLEIPRVAQLKSDKPIIPTTKTTTAELTPTIIDIENIPIQPESPNKKDTESEQIFSFSETFSDQAMGQVTNVSQLRDVQPTDWAYEALRSLVERYGCIVGYPDGTFRGERALSRWEFAAGLNACLNRLEQLIQEGSTVVQEDLERMKRLAEEFQQELAVLGARVDNLEARVSFLENNQFSTTVQMGGEIIFGLAGAWGGNPPGGCAILPDNPIGVGNVPRDPDVDCFGLVESRTTPADNPVFAYLARIGLQASFTGQDRLRMYLVSGNFDNGGFTNPNSFNTNAVRLSYQAGLENNVYLDLLEYRFPIFDDRVVITAIPYGFGLYSVLTANSPFFDIGRGSVSRFGQLNPILLIGGAMKSGVGFDWQIGDPVRLQVAYGTRGSNNPQQGIFSSDHSALGVQLLIQPTETILTGLTYVNAYSGDGSLGTFTGSVNAETGGLWSNSAIPPASDDPLSGFTCCSIPVGNLGAQINAIGGSFQWLITENLTFGAWGGYIFTDFRDRLPNEPALGNSAGKKPFARAVTAAVTLGLADPFGREGDLLGFVVGLPPKLVDAGPETDGVPVPFFEQVVRNEAPVPVTDNNPNILNRQQKVGVPDQATSLHFELFYRFNVTDNISITPGFFFVTNPGHIAKNNTIYVGTVRTTFRF